MAVDSPGAILLVHFDRARDRSALAEQLAADGFEVSLAGTAEHARVLARTDAPALVLLCAGRSPRAALELLCEIRDRDSEAASWHRSVPSILIGAGTAEIEMLRAFEAGADDYLSRACSYLELRARVRALLGRSRASGRYERRLEVRSLAIDTLAHAATLHGADLALRPMEFALLEQLARDPRRVFTKRELLGSVWRYRAVGSTRTVDTHASRLRRKLTAAGGQPWVISVWGVGYRLI